MEFISAEEFLKQPVEVQKVFMDWWQPKVGDLYYWCSMESIKMIEKSTIEYLEEETFKEKFLRNYIPLLTEGQLRQFIEDKDEEKIQFEYYFKIGYSILLFDSEGNNKKTFDCLGNNLLHAYWKVACEIANKCVKQC